MAKKQKKNNKKNNTIVIDLAKSKKLDKSEQQYSHLNISLLKKNLEKKWQDHLVKEYTRLDQKELAKALYDIFGNTKLIKNKKELDKYIKKMHILNKKRIEKNEKRWKKERNMLTKESGPAIKLKEKIIVDMDCKNPERILSLIKLELCGEKAFNEKIYEIRKICESYIDPYLELPLDNYKKEDKKDKEEKIEFEKFISDTEKYLKDKNIKND